MKNLTKIEITDGSDKVVATYHIAVASIRANARRLKLIAPFIEDDEMDNFLKNSMFNCAALACTLCDEKGELLYPNDDTAIDEVMEEISLEVFNILCTESVKVNPPTQSLKAKKKKS